MLLLLVLKAVGPISRTLQQCHYFFFIIIVRIFDILIFSNSLKGSSKVFNYFANIDEALLQFLLSSLWVYWHAASLATGQGPLRNRV